LKGFLSFDDTGKVIPGGEGPFRETLSAVRFRRLRLDGTGEMITFMRRMAIRGTDGTKSTLTACL